MLPDGGIQPRPRLGDLLLILLLAVLFGVAANNGAPAQEPESEPSRSAPLPFPPESQWKRLTADYEVWADLENKQLFVGGNICLREGMLEMFACPRGTKEHESIVAVNTPARFVHGGLLLLGAEAGPPVQFQPEYKPAQGTPVKVEVIWLDAEGRRQRVEAQQWVKQIKSGEALSYPWVFAGSGFWVDKEAGERYYYADGGEFICVSNFSTAMLDLPVASSDANDALMFSAFTERIPPRGTRVYLVLTPQLGKKDAAKPPAETDTTGKPPADAEPQEAPKKEAAAKPDAPTG